MLWTIQTMMQMKMIVKMIRSFVVHIYIWFCVIYNYYVIDIIIIIIIDPYNLNLIINRSREREREGGREGGRGGRERERERERE